MTARGDAKYVEGRIVYCLRHNARIERAPDGKIRHIRNATSRTDWCDSERFRVVDTTFVNRETAQAVMLGLELRSVARSAAAVERKNNEKKIAQGIPGDSDGGSPGDAGDGGRSVPDGSDS